jgi:hypothetical protein
LRESQKMKSRISIAILNQVGWKRIGALRRAVKCSAKSIPARTLSRAEDSTRP